MNTKTPTKINQLLQKVPRGGLLLSSWMYKTGISRELQRHYRTSQWLTPIGTGVMVRTGETPSIFGALASLNGQDNKHFTIGAMAALEMHGFSHYLPMGKKTVVLFSPKEERLPAWLVKRDWDVFLRHFTTECFSPELGIETVLREGFKLTVSSPARAFMECLHLSPKYYNLVDLYYVMEMLSLLPPLQVQELLEDCKSIKVKRLFLYMAEKAGHDWWKMLDLSKISLGAGKRAAVKTGVYSSKYQITIP
ncbi:MAG: type IV toxin-antitoxin system AbiEi family antitoxin, partial [Prevotellaceae bacterium]|nr:type IV toxin-antitoxin system AbiEi family antitoxin [Prevotellaceae bacterium]